MKILNHSIEILPSFSGDGAGQAAIVRVLVAGGLGNDCAVYRGIVNESALRSLGKEGLDYNGIYEAIAKRGNKELSPEKYFQLNEGQYWRG